MYSALPIEMGAYGQPDQRRATDFAFLMPGVQGNNTNGNPTTNVGIVNGSGSRGAAAAVYIDGIPFVVQEAMVTHASSGRQSRSTPSTNSTCRPTVTRPSMKARASRTTTSSKAATSTMAQPTSSSATLP